MKVRSFAKINLGLEVIGKRQDGYHEIRTLFQSVGIFDILEFKRYPRDEIILSGDVQTIPWDKKNLIHQAARLLKEQFHRSEGIEITVQKSIPEGKGLGGGSSNAAMTLQTLNKLWNLQLAKHRLMDLGKELGADVPYFLEGGLCLGRGRGDELTPLEDLKPRYCLLLLPSFPVLTASVYERFCFPLTSDDKDSKIIQFLGRRDLSRLNNALEETIFSLHPQIQACKSLLSSLKPELSLVSGSGSAVFGLFREEEKAQSSLAELKAAGRGLVVKTLSRKDYWEGIKGWGVAKR